MRYLGYNANHLTILCIAMGRGSKGVDLAAHSPTGSLSWRAWIPRPVSHSWASTRVDIWAHSPTGIPTREVPNASTGRSFLGDALKTGQPKISQRLTHNTLLYRYQNESSFLGYFPGDEIMTSCGRLYKASTMHIDYCAISFAFFRLVNANRNTSKIC